MRMHRIFGLFALCLLVSALAFSQAQTERLYKAVVFDSLQKTAVEGCTVSVIAKGVTAKTTTNSKGYFSFSLRSDSTTLLLQHIGYREKSWQALAPKNDSIVDTIYVSPVSKEMEEVVVRASVPPIVIRGDTTEYNIDSSMFEPFDVVEDLIKRLPGLQIDAEGRMTFQGKPISRILVDGEDLFGGDPEFSLRKLPAGMVAKIQVMDTRTLEQLFNNTPSDGEDKTLNIKLKAGNKFFGSADAMAGTRNQAQLNGNLSQFNNSKRINLTGSANTSNKIGIAKRGAGPSSSNTNTGINYGNTFGTLRLNSSYSYATNSNSNRMLRERTQIITADTSFFTRSANQSENSGSTHRASINANWFIDSSSTIDLSFSLNKSNSRGENNSSSTTLENGSLRNESSNNNNSTSKSEGATANLAWNKRLNRKGRSISISARTNVTNQTSNLLSQSYNTYFKSGLAVNGDTLYRETINTTNNRGYAIGASYSEPLSKSLRLMLRGDFDVSNSATNREIYNLDSVTHTAKFDSLYSADISSYNATQNFTASINYFSKKWNLSSGLSTVMQQTVRKLQNDEIRQQLLRYAPSVTASYVIAPAKILRANFSANTIQPTIEQLQPVPDNSNPLYVRLGNPSLRTAFSQNYGLSYSYYDTAYTINAGVNYAPVSNQIVNAVYYDEFRRQTSRYVNVDGVYSVRGNVYSTLTRRKGKRSNVWGTTSNINYGQQVFSQSNQLYFSRNYSASGELSFSIRELAARANSYTIALSATTSRNWTPADLKVLNTSRLSIAPRLDGSISIGKMFYTGISYNGWYSKINYHSDLRRNDEYSTHYLTARLNVYAGKLFSLQANLQYQYNTQAPVGASKGLPSFNMSASLLVLKRRGQLVLSGFDLFSPNNNLRRVVGENFIEDVQMENLRNYFTVKFQYSFSKLEKKERNGRTQLK